MRDDLGLWGRLFQDPEDARGYCRSCHEWVTPEPVAFDMVDDVDVPTLWRLPEECPTPGCRSPLLFPDKQPRCKHYRCSRFVGKEGDYCAKHARKPKPAPRRQGRCGHCNRFLPLNRKGPEREYCLEPRWCRKYAERARARATQGS